MKESLSVRTPQSSCWRGAVSMFGHPPDKTLSLTRSCYITDDLQHQRLVQTPAGHVISLKPGFYVRILSVSSNKVLFPLLMLSKGRAANKHARGLLHMLFTAVYKQKSLNLFSFSSTGQSGLGKSTLVNTLFKSKVSRKSCTPNHEEKISKTVHLQSVSHSELHTHSYNVLHPWLHRHT